MMRIPSTVRAGAIALAALTASAAAANAATGAVSIDIVKAGFLIGASGGSGELTLGGKTYRLTIGGISGGLVFGGARLDFNGSALHLGKASDIEGAYAAVGAGAAAMHGQGAIELQNANGVTLELHGVQRGLLVNADFSGFAISLK